MKRQPGTATEASAVRHASAVHRIIQGGCVNRGRDPLSRITVRAFLRWLRRRLKSRFLKSRLVNSR
ncbi:MAG: hypothetical protein DMD81_04665 [Candidatus Rokuibacteriota bacterium]|nr:MAG: hypothetical protein DMD81_04665 [Candidatus Rokubacteria bacterium]